MYRNTFINGRAHYGGAIYSMGSRHYAEDNIFTNNIAVGAGGAYFFSYISIGSSTREIFTNNKGLEGDVFKMDSVSFTISNAVMKCDFPPQFIKTTWSKIVIKDSVLEQTGGYTVTTSTTLRDGSGLWIDPVTRIVATNNQFKNLISKNGVFF